MTFRQDLEVYKEAFEVKLFAKLAYPDDLHQAGDASPMTCSRVIAVKSDEFQIWVKASSTKQYRCPWCEGLYRRCQPCTDPVFYKKISSTCIGF